MTLIDMTEDERSLRQLWNEWEQDGRMFWQEIDELTNLLENIGNSVSE